MGEQLITFSNFALKNQIFDEEGNIKIGDTGVNEINLGPINMKTHKTVPNTLSFTNLPYAGEAALATQAYVGTAIGNLETSIGSDILADYVKREELFVDTDGKETLVQIQGELEEGAENAIVIGSDTPGTTNHIVIGNSLQNVITLGSLRFEVYTKYLRIVKLVGDGKDFKFVWESNIVSKDEDAPME
jgi:hypothetical protein